MAATAIPAAGMRVQHTGDVRARLVNRAVDHVAGLVDVVIRVGLPNDLAVNVNLHET